MDVFSYIHSTTVPVSDQQAAHDFYVNALGWEKAFDQSMGEDRFLTVVPPGATTQLVLAPAHWLGSNRTMGGETGITLVCDDVDETYKTLTEQGVKFKEPPADMPWGQRAAWFYDLDGNEFFLVSGE